MGHRRCIGHRRRYNPTLYSRLPVLRSVSRSRLVVIGVGVNDLKYRTIGEIAAGYERLLDRLTSVPDVFVVSVLPVDESDPAARERRYLRNSNIAALNQMIRKVCEEQAHCHFIDAAPTLTGTMDGTFAEPWVVLQ